MHVAEANFSLRPSRNRSNPFRFLPFCRSRLMFSFFLPAFHRFSPGFRVLLLLPLPTRILPSPPPSLPPPPPPHVRSAREYTNAYSPRRSQREIKSINMWEAHATHSSVCSTKNNLRFFIVRRTPRRGWFCGLTQA